jgi:hypothetical protein
MNIGELTDAIYDIKQQNAELNKQVEENKATIERLTTDLLQALDAAGLDYSRTSLAKAVVTEDEYPSVVDWDALGAYIVDTNQLFLLQKRLTVNAYRDLVHSGEEIPGVETFTKRTVTVGKAPKSK